MAGPIRISILANAGQANRAFASVSAQANGMGVRVGRAGKALGLAVAAGAAVAGVAVAKFGQAAVTSASNAQQSLGATQTVFGRYADTVIKRSSDAAKAIGLSANEYRELSNVVGASLTGAGVPLRKTTQLTDQLNRRAADMAATFGGTTRQAVESISSLMRGEADPIEQYGVSIKQVDVNARLAAKGQDKLTGSALKAAEMQARLDLLMQKTARTQGAFAREGDTLAHQQQVLGAQWENLKATVGAALLPVLTRLLTLVNNNLGPAFSVVMGYIAPLVDQFRNLGSGAAGSNSAISAVAGFFTGRLIPAVQQVIAAYQAFYAAFVPIITQVAAAIAAKWGTIAPQVQAIWASVKNIITSALSIVQSVVKVATAVVVAIWSKLGATLTRFTATSLGNVVTALRGAFKIIEGIFKVVSSALRGDWKGVWDGIKKILTGALTVIKASLAQAWNMVRTAASAAWAAFKAVIAAAWSAVVAVVKSNIAAVVNLVKTIKGKITGAMSGAKTWLREIGVNIVQGLVNGIDSVIHWVTEKIQQLADKIPGWVKKRLGIASPSKVMRDVGRWIPAGLALGITDGTTGVQQAVEDITKVIERRADDQIKRAGARIKARATFIADQIEAEFEAREKRLRKTLKGKKLDRALDRNDTRRESALKAAELGSARALRTVEQQIGAQRKTNLAILMKWQPWIDASAAGQEAIASKLADARAQLEDMVKAQRDYAQAVKDTVVASGSLTSLGEGDDFGSLEQLISRRTAAVQKAAKWADVIEQLRGRLNDTDLQDLIAKGPSSLKIAETILSGGDAAIATMNTLADQLATIGTNLGTSTSQEFYGDGVAGAKAWVEGLESQQATMIAGAQALYAQIDAELARANLASVAASNDRGKAIGRNLAAGLLDGVAGSKAAIKKAADELGDALIKQVKKTLGIESPSKVFRTVGDNVIRGLRIGLDDTYVRRSGATLAASLQTGFGQPALNAWVASGPPDGTEAAAADLPGEHDVLALLLERLIDTVREQTRANADNGRVLAQAIASSNVAAGAEFGRELRGITTSAGRSRR